MTSKASFVPLSLSHSVETISFSGHVIIADSKNNRVQVLTPELRFLCQIGRTKVCEFSGFSSCEWKASLQNGGSLMERPVDVAVHPDGRIFVVDFGNNKVRPSASPLSTLICPFQIHAF